MHDNGNFGDYYANNESYINENKDQVNEINNPNFNEEDIYVNPEDIQEIEEIDKAALQEELGAEMDIEEDNNNNINIENNDDIKNEEINDYVKKEYYNKKENKFVLDCTNLEKSKLKYYVPLFDYNLNEFFGNKLIRKELVNKGFINSKGFINYDPLYMKEIGISKNKIIQNSKSVNQNNILKNQMEGNSQKKILNNMPSMKIKLPAIQLKTRK